MPKKRSKFRNKIEELALRFVIGLIGIFPYKISLNIGKFIGRTVVRVFPKLAKTAERNLEIAFPGISESRKKQIITGIFESLGRQLGFISQFKNFRVEDFSKYFEIVGKKDFYDPAAKTGRGIIICSAHFGGWEVVNLLPPVYDARINLLVRRIDNSLVEDYIDSVRTKFGTVTIGKKDSPRNIIRILRNGGLLGILADLNAQLHDGIFVDFFDVPASTTMSIAKLALRTDAIILPGFAVWEEEKQKYVVYIEPPVEYEKTDDPQKDIVEITQKITNVVEKYVRKYPEQWLWIHKRWKTRPKGEKELY